MITHQDLGTQPFARRRKLHGLIAAGEVTLGGYSKNKIYGTLDCTSGRRMKPENRVFFRDAADAQVHGYRPCGHCLPQAYRAWKAAQKKISSESGPDPG